MNLADVDSTTVPTSAPTIVAETSDGCDHATALFRGDYWEVSMPARSF